ncbi:MAG TPA: AAA family ATPase, partial [Firmicutes bacterium]|nr:AAA family ATPase [Bacillota bacterium]
NTPDPKFFFLSRQHQEALSRLVYAAQARRGFVLLTGEIGSGKTTLCRALMNRLRLTTEVALVTNANITSKELISSIAEELGVSTRRKSKGAILRELNRFLIEQLSLDRNVLVILDEAQNLRGGVLEEVRMLSNLETAQEKLVQIFLVGQPELREKLNQPELKQLRQRIALRYHVLPLDGDECRNYITHRLNVAEAERVPQFSAAALEKIFRYSQGVPRLVNTVCDNALIVGFTRGTLSIDGDIIEEVIADLEGSCPPSDEEALRL